MSATPKAMIKTPATAKTTAVFPAEEARCLSLSEAVEAFHAHATDARRTYNGRQRTLFESDPERVDRFIALLVEGNYRETAAQAVGITGRAVWEWMHKADEEGDPRYEVIARVIRVAEAVAEARAVHAVRSAAKDPRFWAADDLPRTATSNPVGTPPGRDIQSTSDRPRHCGDGCRREDRHLCANEASAAAAGSRELLDAASIQSVR